MLTHKQDVFSRDLLINASNKQTHSVLEQTLNKAVSNQTSLNMIDTKTITDTNTFMKRQLTYLTQYNCLSNDRTEVVVYLHRSICRLAP